MIAREKEAYNRLHGTDPRQRRTVREKTSTHFTLDGGPRPIGSLARSLSPVLSPSFSEAPSFQVFKGKWCSLYYSLLRLSMTIRSRRNVSKPASLQQVCAPDVIDVISSISLYRDNCPRNFRCIFGMAKLRFFSF